MLNSCLMSMTSVFPEGVIFHIFPKMQHYREIVEMHIEKSVAIIYCTSAV